MAFTFNDRLKSLRMGATSPSGVDVETPEAGFPGAPQQAAISAQKQAFSNRLRNMRLEGRAELGAQEVSFSERIQGQQESFQEQTQQQQTQFTQQDEQLKTQFQQERDALEAEFQTALSGIQPAGISPSEQLRRRRIGV